MSATPFEPNPLKRLIGLSLFTVGAHWIATSGLCSAGFVVTMFTEGGDFREALSIIMLSDGR